MSKMVPVQTIVMVTNKYVAVSPTTRPLLHPRPLIHLSQQLHSPPFHPPIPQLLPVHLLLSPRLLLMSLVLLSKTLSFKAQLKLLLSLNHPSNQPNLFNLLNLLNRPLNYQKQVEEHGC